MLDAWRERCKERAADPGHCSGTEAVFLVTALGAALRRGAPTPQMARAARSWGATFSSPTEALASLACLREVLPITAEAHSRVLDQLMLEAVDAASASLRAAARTDPMTGCANRLALDDELSRAVRSAQRSGLEMAVAVIDLDGLKHINDTQGHAAGDAALLALVESLRAVLRTADSLFRIGGDEFVVMTPFTDADGAGAMLRRAAHCGAPAFSWGVASLAGTGPAAAEDPQLLLVAADTDLYVRRREWRHALSRSASHRRRVVAVSVAASVALTATGAAALASEVTSAGGAATGTSTAATPGQGASAGALPFRWPRAVTTVPALIPGVTGPPDPGPKRPTASSPDAPAPRGGAAGTATRRALVSSPGPSPPLPPVPTTVPTGRPSGLTTTTVGVVLPAPPLPDPTTTVTMPTPPAPPDHGPGGAGRDGDDRRHGTRAPKPPGATCDPAR